MLQLHREGRSAREISEVLKLSNKTIAMWLGDCGLEPNGGAGARKNRRRRATGKGASTLAAAAKGLAELVAAAPALAPLEHAMARLAQCSAMIDKLRPGVLKNEANPSTLVQLGRYERDLRAEVHELTPPEVPDPENDPTILSAAAEVERKLMLLVEAARRDAKCAACGQSPWATR